MAIHFNFIVALSMALALLYPSNVQFMVHSRDPFPANFPGNQLPRWKWKFDKQILYPIFKPVDKNDI